MYKLAFISCFLLALSQINGEGIYQEQISVITIISPPTIAGIKLTSAYTLFTEVPKRTEDELSGSLASCTFEKVAYYSSVSSI